MTNAACSRRIVKSRRLIAAGVLVAVGLVGVGVGIYSHYAARRAAEMGPPIRANWVGMPEALAAEVGSDLYRAGAMVHSERAAAAEVGLSDYGARIWTPSTGADGPAPSYAARIAASGPLTRRSARRAAVLFRAAVDFMRSLTPAQVGALQHGGLVYYRDLSPGQRDILAPVADDAFLSPPDDLKDSHFYATGYATGYHPRAGWNFSWGGPLGWYGGTYGCYVIVSVGVVSDGRVHVSGS